MHLPYTDAHFNNFSFLPTGKPCFHKISHWNEQVRSRTKRSRPQTIGRWTAKQAKATVSLLFSRLLSQAFESRQQGIIAIRRYKFQPNIDFNSSANHSNPPLRLLASCLAFFFSRRSSFVNFESIARVESWIDNRPLAEGLRWFSVCFDFLEDDFGRCKPLLVARGCENVSDLGGGTGVVDSGCLGGVLGRRGNGSVASSVSIDAD